MTHEVHAAPGGSGATVAYTEEALEALREGKPVWKLSVELGPVRTVQEETVLLGLDRLVERLSGSDPENAERLRSAAEALVTVTGSTRDLYECDIAVEIAGGAEVASGQLFEHLDARAHLRGEVPSAETRRFVEALTPCAREGFVEALATVLRADELAKLSPGWTDDALPTFIPNVELWFADLDQSEQRELTDFVLAAAVEAGTAVRFPSKA